MPTSYEEPSAPDDFADRLLRAMQAVVREGCPPRHLRLRRHPRARH